jgi:hypothetical protein
MIPPRVGVFGPAAGTPAVTDRAVLVPALDEAFVEAEDEELPLELLLPQAASNSAAPAAANNDSAVRRLRTLVLVRRSWSATCCMLPLVG